MLYRPGSQEGGWQDHYIESYSASDNSRYQPVYGGGDAGGGYDGYNRNAAAAAGTSLRYSDYYPGRRGGGAAASRQPHQQQFWRILQPGESTEIQHHLYNNRSVHPSKFSNFFVLPRITGDIL